MKNFEDIRDDLRKENPIEFELLESMGKLVAAKDKVGISQREWSRISGVSQKTISRLENGLDQPEIQTLGKLANALGFEVKISLVERR